MMRASLFVLLLLSACAPSAQAVQTALAQTEAAIPTATQTATATAKPTSTARPTLTSIPTATLIPPKIIFPATMTAEAKDAKIATAAEMASYGTIALKELLNYPDNHVGEKISLRGRVFNIDGTTVQIWVNGYDAVYIELAEPASGIYKDDSMTFYGTVEGAVCFQNTAGNQVCQPGLKDAFYINPRAHPSATPTQNPLQSCSVKITWPNSDFKDIYLVVTGPGALYVCSELAKSSNNQMEYSQVDTRPSLPLTCEVIYGDGDITYVMSVDVDRATKFCNNLGE